MPRGGGEESDGTAGIGAARLPLLRPLRPPCLLLLEPEKPVAEAVEAPEAGCERGPRSTDSGVDTPVPLAIERDKSGDVALMTVAWSIRRESGDEGSVAVAIDVLARELSEAPDASG